VALLEQVSVLVLALAKRFYRSARQLPPSSQRIDIGSAFAQVIVNVSYVADAIFITATGLSQRALFANRSALNMYLEILARHAPLRHAHALYPRPDIGHQAVRKLISAISCARQS
jgi:hypothetical protein